MNNLKGLIIKKSLSDEVAFQLKEQILSGFYHANQKLPIEPELMKAFGVGRSTIREAIKSLTNSGLLRVQQGVGTFVEEAITNTEPMDQRLKRARIQDLDEVRQLLEMKIAERAAINRTEHDIHIIKTHLDERKRTAFEGLLTECIEADIKFHVAIAEASKNEILSDLYKSASVHLKNWFIQIHTDTQVFKETYHLHEQLLKYIIAGSPRQAWNTAAKIIGHLYNK